MPSRLHQKAGSLSGTGEMKLWTVKIIVMVVFVSLINAHHGLACHSKFVRAVQQNKWEFPYWYVSCLCVSCVVMVMDKQVT